MTKKSVTLVYHALIREKSGKDKEMVTVEAQNLNDLYEFLQSRYDIGLEKKYLKAAVNDEIVDWNQSIKDGDIVTFIPPVAGG